MNRHAPALMLAPACLLLGPVALGASLIEMSDGQGNVQQMYFEGARMRGQQVDRPEYVLLDAKAGTMYAVSPAERHVLDMSYVLQADHSASPAAAKIDIDFSEQGSGPEIAGYATTHYAVSVNGQKCSDEYLSKSAMADIGDGEFLDSISRIAGPPDPAAVAQNPCTAAQSEMSPYYRKLGVPMRVVEAKGSETTEVVRIVKGANLPPNGFDVPADYQVLDMQQMMQQSIRAIELEEGRIEQEELDLEELQQKLESMMDE